MTGDENAAAGPRIGAGIVAPINLVNLALPFSKIVVQEPTTEFAELSAIVAELLTVLEGSTPGEAIAALRQRAEVVAARSG